MKPCFFVSRTFCVGDRVLVHLAEPLGSALRAGFARGGRFVCRRSKEERRASLACIVPFVLIFAVSRSAYAETSSSTVVRDFFQKHCLSCHDAEAATADIVLSIDKDPQAARKDADLWEKVAEVIEFGQMPPAEEEQPSSQERSEIAAWIKEELSKVDCSGEQPAGRVTLRRLNRVEYRNTIRDLLGIDFVVEETFPSDDVGLGFDNIGDVLSMSPLLMEKYLQAAEDISRRVIETGPAKPPEFLSFQAKEMQSSLGNHAPDEPNSVLTLFTSGEVFADFYVENAGKYDIEFVAYEDKAGEEPSLSAIKLDGNVVKQMPVQGSQGAPSILSATARFKKGDHRVALEFLNDFYNESAENPKERDRNMHVRSLTLRGPRGKSYSMRSEPHRRVIFFEPSQDAEKADEETAKIATRLASRAFRRPASKSEVKRLTELAAAVRGESGSFEQGIQTLLQAVLTSPHFLFRVEQDPTTKNDDERRLLNEYELAVRLSYFLWSTMPDEELFQLAGEQKLRSQLGPQIKRMLADPKADALAENFGGQWLTLRKLSIVSPNLEVFPEFSEDLRSDMVQETQMLFKHIMRNDRSIQEFVTADYSFINDRLAKLYNLPGVEGSEFRQVSLAGTGRGGVITHASVLTLTSNPGRTSPVKRGKWVLEQILGTPPPPPPPGVGDLPEGREATGTLRERLEIHRDKPMCASCHSRMDPIGFGLENFTGIGAWRDESEGAKIDNSGELPGGRKFSGPDELRAMLAANPAKLRRSIATKMLVYAVGRGMEKSDRCTIDSVCELLSKNDDSFSSLILGVVQSNPFQFRERVKQP